VTRITPLVTLTLATYLPCVSPVRADMPAFVRSSGATPVFRYDSATAAFAAAAKFRPSDTWARIV
jgi:hypothetical protein